MEIKWLLRSSRVDLKILKSILFADCEIKGRFKGLFRKLGGVTLWSGVFLVLSTLHPLPALGLVPQCSWDTCLQFWDTQSKCSGWFKLEKTLWGWIEEDLLGRAFWWDGLIYGAGLIWSISVMKMGWQKTVRCLNFPSPRGLLDLTMNRPFTVPTYLFFGVSFVF